MNNFDSVIGHNKQKRILNNQLKSDQLSHAYLFTGQEGIGKRTLAEIFADEILKKGIINQDSSQTLVDLVKVGYDSESITVKDIRNIIEQTRTRPRQGTYRVFIIDNADLINNVAQNALLKTIEEPNPGNIFILITDKPTKLIDTIKSRCQELLFHDLNETEKKEFLKINNLDSSSNLSLTPGELIKTLNNPEYYQKLEDFYNQFNSIINGNYSDLFNFAEQVSSTKELSEDVLNTLIHKLNHLLINNNEINTNTLNILNYLFELLDILSYNVNLRLQWESCLIKIISENLNE